MTEGQFRDRSLEPEFGSPLLSPAFFVTTWLLQGSLYALVPKGKQISDLATLQCNTELPKEAIVKSHHGHILILSTF